MDSNKVPSVLERRTLLTALGSVGVATLTGCNTGSGSNNDPGQESPPTDTSSPTATDTPTETPSNIPQEGTINVILEGNEPWPDEFFSGDDYDLEVGMTANKLREKYHFNQYKRIARHYFPESNDSPDSDNQRKRELLLEFPENFTVPEWRRENIFNWIEEKYDAEVNDFFRDEEYDPEATLKERTINSNFDGLYKNLEILLFGDVSSTRDFIRTAVLSGSEHYGAGNDTFTLDLKTLDITHGLGTASTNLTYNPQKTRLQRTWGVETDPGEDTPIWPLDKTENYPNDSGKIFRENANGMGELCKRYGFDDYSDDNITVNVYGGEEFENFLRDPGKQIGMNFPDAMFIVAYINDEAHREGKLPEFEDATLDVYPSEKRIEYQLAA